ncbi:MAG: phosphate signaling complex protein PhoU [Chloroflexia bacterium]|nr:phosphate signaling complex protein PhoU [Chloroflexia bacterium]
MLRQSFSQKLKNLQDEVLVLASMVDRALGESVEALRERNRRRSEVLIDGDCVINDKRFSIEYDCLAFIATQQPMAGDLRMVAAILEIVTDLERIGDYAKGIARINLMMNSAPALHSFTCIPQMADKARGMLRRSMDAFVERDLDAARAIAAEDDEVDELYNQVYRGLVQLLVEDASSVDHSNYLLWVAHNLERTADRVTNICERILFTVTGEMEDLGDDEDLCGI